MYKKNFLSTSQHQKVHVFHVNHYLSVCTSVKVAQSFPTLWDSMDSLWNSPGQNIGVGSGPLLQGILPTQGSNPGLPHCRQILHQLSHQRSPRILEWVVYPFSRGSSQPRNWTRVSCIAGRLFTSWATREAHLYAITPPKIFYYFVLTAGQVSFGLKLRNPQQFKFLWMSFLALAVLFQPTSRSWP